VTLSNASVIEAAKPLRQRRRHRPLDVDQRRIDERQTGGSGARRQYRFKASTIGAPRKDCTRGTVVFIVYIVGWMVLILVVGGWLVGRQRRKADAGMRQVAATLGYRLLENMEAIDRSIVPAMRQAALEAREKMPEFFRKMAERPARGFLCVAGEAEGVEVSIFLESSGGGRSKTTYTVIRADYPKPLPFEMRVGSEGALTRLGKALFELRDVEIGDPEFDRAVRVKAADEAGAKAALGKPGARDAVLGLLALSTSAFASNAYAQWVEQGYHFDTAKTRERVAVVAAVARSLGRE